MKLNHKQKVRIARQLITNNEEHPGLFRSLGWRKRKFEIMQRVKRQEARAKYWSEVRSGERDSQYINSLKGIS